MSRKRKMSGHQQGSARKKQQRRGHKHEAPKPEEEPIDMDFELRKAYAQMKRNKAQIEAGETYASQRQRGRTPSPGRTDRPRCGQGA